MRAARTTAPRSEPWSLSATPWRSRSTICAPAPASLGLRNVRAFMFQEGYDPVCEQAFREIARLTRGAYCRFAPGAAHELAELLRAAAAYAAGGMKALADLQAAARRRRGQAARAAEVAMPLIFGVVVLILLLWAVNAFSKADPKQVGAAAARHGRRRRAVFAAFLLLRGEIGLAIPLGAVGLGLLGWISLWPASFARRARKRARARPRGCAPPFSKWSSITTAARCAAAFWPDATQGASLDALDRTGADRPARRDRRRQPRSTCSLS